MQLCSCAGVPGRGGSVDVSGQRCAGHPSRQDPPHPSHRARPQARQIRHVRSHSAPDSTPLPAGVCPRATISRRPRPLELVELLSDGECRRREVWWLQRAHAETRTGTAVIPGRIIEDYAVIYCGSAVFKISRLLFIALMCVAPDYHSMRCERLSMTTVCLETEYDNDRTGVCLVISMGGRQSAQSEFLCCLDLNV